MPANAGGFAFASVAATLVAARSTSSSATTSSTSPRLFASAGASLR
jgi:hypothetical protein